MPRQPGGEHVFERYTKALTERITKHQDFIRQYVAPKGGRIPFTKMLNESDALEWWKAHINDDYGKQAMSGMDPLDMIKLQQKLREMDGEGS